MANGKFFNKKAESPQQKLNSARQNLLLMIVLTLVNVVLFFTGSDTMMLFSATVPYMAVVFGEWLAPSSLAMALYILAGALIAAYFLCWLLSKKHFGWMIIALVLFVIDFLALIYFYIQLGDFSGVLDFLIHAWVLYYLVIGVIGGVKLKKMPPEQNEQLSECLNADPEQFAE